MGIEGVIFDFNGTLFFDTHIHNQAWDIFLRRHSLELREDEKNKKIHGKNNADILTNLFSNKLSLEDIKRLSVEKEDIYQSLCLNQEMRLAPGAEDLLEYLLLKKIPFTIATASDLYNLKFYFEHLNLARYFEMPKIVYSNGKVKSKPNPEIFIKAMDILKINANQTLIFEDSTSGIRAAENSNAKKIIIVKSTNDDYDEWNHQIISSFSEVERSIFETNCR